MKVGDKFKADYPFKSYCSDFINFDGTHETDEGWAMGCHITHENCYTTQSLELYFTADGIGSIEFEILAIVDMPRRYQQRIIYKFSTVDPDGVFKTQSNAHTVTKSKFEAMIVTPYRAKYELNE